MYNLVERVSEFMDWLEYNTDFREWDESTKTEVHMKLIVFMCSPIQLRLPFEEEKK